MAKMTLLEMTQDILSRMSSDEVNSIGDTAESLQVAGIIKQKYRDITSRSAIPEHSQLFQLTPSNASDKPTVMHVPENVDRIDWIKYYDSELVSSVAGGYKYVIMLPLQQFIDMVDSFNTNDTDVGTYDLNDFTFYYKNAANPCYCTVLSNETVLFDSYDSSLDSTLQETKTMCSGQISPVFLMEDTFIPDLHEKEFSLLFNEAMATAFYELKQMPNAKAEQEVKRQWSSVSKNKSIDNKPSYFDQLPDFGRPAGFRPWFKNGFNSR